MSPTKRRTILFTVTAVVSLFLDQWTKVLARADLKPLASWRSVVVVDGYFDLRYSENTGVAFGMLQQLPGGRILLSLMALAALALVFPLLAPHRSPPNSPASRARLGGRGRGGKPG